MRSLKLRDICAGTRHSLALSEEGDVYAWGFGGRTTGVYNYLSWFKTYSPLGLGDSGDIAEPSLIEDIRDVKQIAAGNDFSIALHSSGKLYGWGDSNVLFG